MKGHGEKLSRTQERAIAALLQCPTMTEAATAAGISEATLWRWLRLPAFQEEYRAARRQAVQQAVTAVQRITSTAVATLEGIMNDATAPPASRVTAARVVLDTALKAVELEDLEQRIAALEERLAAPPRRRRG